MRENSSRNLLEVKYEGVGKHPGCLFLDGKKDKQNQPNIANISAFYFLYDQDIPGALSIYIYADL